MAFAMNSSLEIKHENSPNVFMVNVVDVHKRIYRYPMHRYRMTPTSDGMIREDNITLDTSSYLCPPEVKDSFAKLTKSSRYTWNGHTVQFFYARGNCDRNMQYIATLLSVLPCNKPLRADILLSPVKKKYPKDRVFGPSNVNTGYASDEKIVVYRKEEWMKVFIHECFHYFHFEKELMDPQFVPRILALFPVHSEVNVYEAYCEVWARTLNGYLISAYTQIPVSILLRDEKKYSMRHMVNVLHHMGVTYKEIQEPGSGFREKTNVLAYVVLANIVFNQGYVESHPDIQADGESFVRFIETHYQNPRFVRAIEHIKPQQTTTMSFHSIDSLKHKKI